MVGGSELAFRLLARRHGAQLCYTPMMQSETFITTLKKGARGPLEVHADDGPLVAHFSGNDPATLLAAGKRAECCNGVVAVDLNLGCPQRSAASGHFGAYLCVEPDDRQRVLRIVSTLATQLTVPVFCKVRLLDDGVEATVLFAQQLQAAGCALLAVHGRYRGSPMHRRDGAAHLEQVRAIKQSLAIPVLTNGNVRSAAELLDTLEYTGCDGVMTAEGALDDPAIFAKAIAHVHAERERLTAAVQQGKALKAAKRDQGRELTKEEKATVKGRKQAKARLKQLPELQPPPPLSPAVPMPPLPLNAAASTSATPSAQFDLAEQYVALVEKHPPPGGADALLSHSIFHLRRLCRTPLTDFDLLAGLKACTSLAACAEIIRTCRAYAEGATAFKGPRRPPSYWRRQKARGKI